MSIVLRITNPSNFTTFLTLKLPIFSSKYDHSSHSLHEIQSTVAPSDEPRTKNEGVGTLTFLRHVGSP